MSTTDTREAKRTPVTLKIKFKSESLDQFIERYSVDISHGGIFIRTKDPLSVGTTLRFEFQLKDATPLITGDGTVVWTREHDPSRAGVAPGMGVRFDRLPGQSQKVLDQILDHKSGSSHDDEDDDDDGGEFKDTPTRVAPAQLVDKLVSNDFSESGDRTPLPRPMPFHSDADDFPDETFEEATRVASLDSLVASTKSSDDDDGGDDVDVDDEAERALTSPVSADDEGDSEGAAASSSRPEADTAPPPSARPQADTTPAPTASSGSEAESSDADAESSEADAESSDADADDDGLELGESGHLDDDDELAAADDDDEDHGRAAVAPAVDPVEDAGGSMPWIAAAAAILIIGGIGGFWFLSQNRERDAQAQQAERTDTNLTATAAATAADEPPDEAAEPAEPDEPPVTTVPVTIESVPKGATVELVGADQGGTAPATLELEEGKSYQVEVSHPGYVARTLEVRGGDEPPAVELEVMKKIVRVTSTPPGATVVVNGKRQRGATPLDLEIDARLARRDDLKIAVRRSGYQTWSTTVSTRSEFAEVDGALVQAVSATLERREVARRPEPKDEGGDDTDDAADDSGEAGKEPVDEPEPAKNEVDLGGGEAKPAEPDKPTEPTKPAGEAATDPAGPAAKPAAAPTPDWMK